MKQSYVIGIDISKSKIDCVVMSSKFELIKEIEIGNTDLKIKQFIKKILLELKLSESDILVCCENTGIYNRPLERVCQELGVDIWVEHALKIKRASTDMRGKNDRQDARRIAEYAVRYNDKQILFKEPLEVIKELNINIKIRETLIEQKVAIQNQLRESKSHDKKEYDQLNQGYKQILKALVKSIENVEMKIYELSRKHVEISENIDLMTSIPGIGAQNALNILIATNNFQTFNSAKHLACYAGVVPFQNQSGTLIKRDRVSKMANKKLKKLLHMAAMCAIRYDLDIKEYYQKKVGEGKNKMSVLNAIRNKLVHRIMAVINRKTPYIKKISEKISESEEKVCILT
jgi:transposase